MFPCAIQSMLDQLRGREQQTRFLLNKADLIEASEVTRVTGTVILLAFTDNLICILISYIINRISWSAKLKEYLLDYTRVNIFFYCYISS